MVMTGVPQPVPDPISQPFWDALIAGRLAVQHCQNCDLWVWYPKAVCPRCWAPGLAWTELSGMGTVRSHTTIRRPVFQGWADRLPYTVGLITPVETSQVRLVAALLTEGRVSGQQVCLQPIKTDQYPLLAFTDAR